MTTTSSVPFAVYLPCGCLCSFVFTSSEQRAMKLLFGPTKSQAVKRYAVRPVPSVEPVIAELRKAIGRRFECRADHNPAKGTFT